MNHHTNYIKLPCFGACSLFFSPQNPPWCFAYEKTKAPDDALRLPASHRRHRAHGLRRQRRGGQLGRGLQRRALRS